MKHSLFRTLLVLFLLFFSIGINAEDDKTTDDIPISILTPKHTKGPRMPSHIFIECSYSVGHLSFVIPSGILFLNVSLSKNDNILWNGIVTRENPETSIPLLPSGEYVIICQTDGNQIFHGSLTY